MADSDLERQVREAIDGDNTILASCQRFLEVIAPAFNAIGNGIRINYPDRELIYRCIARRGQENLAMIVATATSEYPYMSPMPLRPLCEDLIYGCWLRKLSQADADELIELSIFVDIAKSIHAQDNFLPGAYAKYSVVLSEDEQVRDDADNKPVTWQSTVGVGDAAVQRAKQQLKALGLRLGWTKGKQPTIRDMAEECGLLDIYEFFYHGSSKAVHSSLHNMGRMVWGEPGGLFDVSSHNFEGYYVAFALAYGLWLTEELLSRLVQIEFPTEFDLIDADAHKVWVALVITGLARNKSLPPLVTTEELRWSR